MVTQQDNGMARVTVTLAPDHVRVLDALAKFEGSNRSAELRGLLDQVMPIMNQLVATFTTAEGQRAQLDQALVNATISELQAIEPEAEELGRQFMRTMAKLEGTAAAAAEPEAPASNTGATT